MLSQGLVSFVWCSELLFGHVLVPIVYVRCFVMSTSAGERYSFEFTVRICDESVFRGISLVRYSSNIVSRTPAFLGNELIGYLGKFSGIYSGTLLPAYRATYFFSLMVGWQLIFTIPRCGALSNLYGRTWPLVTHYRQAEIGGSNLKCINMCSQPNITIQRAFSLVLNAKDNVLKILCLIC